MIDQTGLDLQWTKYGWLWKLEIISRDGHGDRFTALAGGFEYTFVGVFNTAADLGLLAEYLYDDRDDEIKRATAPFEDDVFIGARLTFNDAQSTELLAGLIIDTDSDTTLWFLEGSRRLRENWTLDLEVRAFNGISSDDPSSASTKTTSFSLHFHDTSEEAQILHLYRYQQGHFSVPSF